MTFAAIMLWLKTFFASVPRTVYTHGLAFVVGVVLRGCIAVALVMFLAGPALAGQPCPVNGSNCTCGCVQGGTCNCAISHVAAERLTRLDPQALAYRDLYEWAKAHPGQYAIVYVGRDVPADISDEYMQVPKEARCRYDAGWPTVKTPTVIYASYRNGEFVEVFRSPPAVRAAQFRQSAFQPFGGGNCSGGRCR